MYDELLADTRLILITFILKCFEFDEILGEMHVRGTTRISCIYLDMMEGVSVLSLSTLVLNFAVMIDMITGFTGESLLKTNYNFKISRLADVRS
jgi:hypothetical protein